jgi:hypothetical protein
MALKQSESNLFSKLDELKIKMFKYDAIIVITGHSNYSLHGCIKTKNDDRGLHPLYPHQICTLSVADPGTCSFINNTDANRLVNPVLQTTFGESPQSIMKICKDFLKYEGDRHPNTLDGAKDATALQKEENAFYNCEGQITVPTQLFYNRKYDFFNEQNAPDGAIYLLHKNAQGIVVVKQPWNDIIHGPDGSMTKNKILQSMLAEFSYLRNILWVDLSCSVFTERVPPHIKSNIQSGLFAGKSKNKTKNKKKKKSTKSKK